MNATRHAWFPEEGFVAVGERIVKRWDPALRSGSILIHDYHTAFYPLWLCSSIVFFILLRYLVDALFRTFKVDFFMKKSRAERVDSITAVMGFTHHLLLMYLTWKPAIYACSDSDEYPVDDTHWQRFRWFVSPTCALQPNEMYPIAVLFTIGYLIVDFYVLKVIVEKRTKIQNQFLWHHVVAVTGFSGCLAAGYGLPGMACMTLLCEISSIFLSIRNLFPKEKQKTKAYLFNQIIFFLLFTVFRMGLFPYMLYLVWFDLVAAWQYRSTVGKIISIFCLIQAWATFLINAFWYRFILRTAINTLGPSKSKADTKDLASTNGTEKSKKS